MPKPRFSKVALLLMPLVLWACASARIDTKHPFDGVWHGRSATVATANSDQTACRPADIEVVIRNNTIEGTAVDSTGAAFAVYGYVGEGGHVDAGIALGGSKIVSLKGRMTQHRGDGTWEATDGCKGDWHLVPGKSPHVSAIRSETQ